MRVLVVGAGPTGLTLSLALKKRGIEHRLVEKLTAPTVQSRAIETRRTLLRVTNTGVTSVVNAKGEIVQTLPMFTGALMETEVEILNGETFYDRFGDWFGWTLTAISAAVLLLVAKQRLFG